MNSRLLYINGEWTEAGSGRCRDVIDPATGEAIASVAHASAEDAQQAISAARHAFDHGPWPALSSSERAGHLRSLIGALRDPGFRQGKSRAAPLARSYRLGR